MKNAYTVGPEIARLFEEKYGLNYLILAFYELKKRVKNIELKLLIVG